jgi:S-adenosylmethionine uptake transporter
MISKCKQRYKINFYTKSSYNSGLIDMLVAGLLFSLMNTSVYAISRLDSDIDDCVISFVRILCNLAILALPVLLRSNAVSLFGDRRPSLWLRGLFGASALMLSFVAIHRIGPGESAFLTASNGVFIALLGPLVLGQKNSWLVWLAIIGSFVGISLLVAPGAENADLLGRTLALASGFLSALAYLMVARAGRSNSPASVIFYFCLMALILHGLYFAVYGFRFPQRLEIWGLLLFTGLVGSGAQHFMTRAYQRAPAASVGAVGYLAPVLSLAWGALVFNQLPSDKALLGSSLIFWFGVILPFVRTKEVVKASSN